MNSTPIAVERAQQIQVELGRDSLRVVVGALEDRLVLDQVRTDQEPAARDDVKRTGGILDEARVNRLRYLEGTPRESTRWIDTGWAIVLVQASPLQRLD